MLITRAALALAGMALLAVAPAGAQTVASCAGKTPQTFESPAELGSRDLETLATNVAADRAAMTHSCELLVEDRQILDRIANAH